MSTQSRLSRRKFLATMSGSATVAAAAPYFVRASALGLGGSTPPSDRIVMGAIGTGGQGKHDTGEFLKLDDVQFVAVCDVDSNHAAEGKKQVDERYSNQDCRTYGDFRDFLSKEQLDAVLVATPDHWHALAAIAALKAARDIYCEKPLANSVREAMAVRDAAHAHQRILQTGSQERSNPSVRFAAELVRSGALGKISTVEVNMPFGDEPHQKEVLAFKGIPEPMPVPDNLDWDFWLGHTPVKPYHERRCHFWWRFILSYGGGEMTDRGADIIDLAQFVLDMDHSGPVKFAATGKRNPENLYDAFVDYHFECTYANGVQLIGANREPRGLKITGDAGWIFIHIHGGRLEAEPAELLERKNLSVDLGRTPGHHRNFIDSVKSRQQPFAHAEIGCRTATICHLNNIAMLVGRPLQWDPAKEQLIGDDEASKLLLPSMRQPWTL